MTDKGYDFWQEAKRKKRAKQLLDQRNNPFLNNGGMPFKDALLYEYMPRQITHPHPIKGKWTYPGPGLIQWRK